MFQAFGRIVTRYPWLWIGGWLLVLVILRLSAPEWSSVSSRGELQHLPANAPSRHANELFADAFPEERSESNIVVVLRRQGKPLEVDDYLFMAQQLVPRLHGIADKQGGVIQPSILQQLESSLAEGELSGEQLAEELQQQADQRAEEAEEAEESHRRKEAEKAKRAAQGKTEDEGQSPRIVSITAPHNSLIGPLLVSSDEQAMLVLLPLTSTFLTSANDTIITDVEQSVESLRKHEKKPPGLDIFITGSAILGRDVVGAVTESTNAIQNWTIWLVLALLLLTFRAPLVSLIPLVTLYVAVTISLDLMAVLAGGGVISIFDGLQIYATVLIYGAGVDYGMFLISRFREELSHGQQVKHGLAIAITKVGFAIVISAGTEILGVGVLSFADFGKFSQSGTTIPVGLLITLFASLTFTVALLRVVGRWGFWPQKLSSSRSKTNITGDRADEDIDETLVYRIWERIGKVVRARPLLVWSITLAAMLPFCLVAIVNHSNVTYDMTSGLPSEAPSLEGNAMLQEHFSRGIIGPVTVLLRNDELEFSDEQGTDALVGMTEHLLENAEGFEIADLQVLIRPAGTSPRAQQLVKQLQTTMPGRWDRIAQTRLADKTEAEKKQIIRDIEELVIKNAKRYYVSQADQLNGHVTRMTLILDDDPFSKQSIVSIDAIRRQVREALPESVRGRTTVSVMGPTASLYDVRTTAERDRQFMYTWVTIVVLVILIILLRKLIVPIYLVATVALTYLTTMGVTYVLFMAINGSDFSGLQWTVPTLLFTLLMAVGADYNVLLVERYEEEKQKHGAGTGVVRSLASTGGLITGAGVVMAGTFLALNLGGTLDSMQQLGFALAFGVLIDTFLVRPLLVPSFLLLFKQFWDKTFGEKREPEGEA